MTYHLDLPLINYVLDIITNIENSVGNVSKDKFLNSPDIRDANVRRLEIISDSMKNLSKDFKDKYPDISWNDFINLKERLSNQYFGIDFNIIWDTLKKDIPKLKNQISLIK